MEDHFSQLISSGQCFHFNHIVFAGCLLPNPPFHNFEVLLVLWGMLLKEGSLGTWYLGAEDGGTCRMILWQLGSTGPGQPFRKDAGIRVESRASGFWSHLCWKVSEWGKWKPGHLEGSFLKGHNAFPCNGETLYLKSGPTCPLQLLCLILLRPSV